jgi:alpha-L-arabinofuranosidase
MNQPASILLEGCKHLPFQAFVTTLKGNDKELVNTILQPRAVVPMESTIPMKGKNVAFVAAPNSFSVIRIKM